MTALHLLNPENTPGPSENEQAAIERWLRGKSENTRKSYMDGLRLFLAAAGAETIEQACGTAHIARRSFSAFCDALEGKRARTRYKRLVDLRKLLVLCHEENVCPDVAKYVPAEDHRNKDSMQRWYPSDAEIQRMIRGEDDPRRRLLLQVLYGMGLRASEAINLRLENVRYFERTGTWAVYLVGKGGKGADVPIPDALVPEVMRLQLENGENGSWFDRGYRWANMVVKEALKRIGVDEKGMACHSLRHAHCQNTQEAGVSEDRVSRNLRHSDIRTTRQYGRFVDKSPGEVLGLEG